jgi:Tfp pilus assembly protein PilV
MEKLARLRNEQGITLVEVLIAIPILVIGILAVMSTLTVGFVDVAMSGGQAKATTYARQQMELLKNQAFTVGPVNANDVPEPGMTRTWSIQQVGATPAPNRLARITVTVTWRPGGTSADTGTPQSITLETMRAE